MLMQVGTLAKGCGYHCYLLKLAGGRLACMNDISKAHVLCKRQLDCIKDELLLT